MNRFGNERRDRPRIEASLVRLRAIYHELRDTRAGVAVLHLEAAVAALESRLRRSCEGQAS